jgi:23S rRNA (adenine2503-C2)-methyltransferase
MAVAETRLAPLSTTPAPVLLATFEAWGVPSFRAQQLAKALWQPFIGELDDIRQLPVDLRDQIRAHFLFSTLPTITESEADGGETIKLLCALADGQSIETVAMETPARGPRARRGTICVSSQVGCAVGCPFCATGQLGLLRNCTAAEIVDQVRAGQNALFRRGFGPVTNIVFMGMGEPMHNYDAVLSAIRILVAQAGLSPRRITVSTSGMVPGITRLTKEDLSLTLAVSLHATTDELRDRLVPINKKYPIASVIDSAKDYAAATGRRITLEWCLIGGINDSVEEAARLKEIARKLTAHINVIPMNRIDGSEWGPPEPAIARRFLQTLQGANVTVRDTRGNENEAACGQLRAALQTRAQRKAMGSRTATASGPGSD